MASYKGIVFAKDYNKSFADFKKEFASTHIFRNIPSDRREAELRKAYEIATAHLKAKKNGNPKTSAKEGQQGTIE